MVALFVVAKPCPLEFIERVGALLRGAETPIERTRIEGMIHAHLDAGGSQGGALVSWFDGKEYVLGPTRAGLALAIRRIIELRREAWMPAGAR